MTPEFCYLASMIFLGIKHGLSSVIGLCDIDLTCQIDSDEGLFITW